MRSIWERADEKTVRLQVPFTCDSVTGTEKTEGTFRKNVCGTYVHGIFDKEDVAMGLVRAVGEKKASMSLIWQEWILRLLKKHSMIFLLRSFANIWI